MNRELPREINPSETQKDGSSKYDALPKEELERIATEYLAKLGLSFSDLENKKVVDLGSGHGTIGKVAKDKGIEIISFDNDKKCFEKKKDVGDRLVGDAAALPLKNESIDLILSHHSPPYGNLPIEEFKHILNEMIKVLKKNGEVRLTPRPYDIVRQHQKWPARLKKPENELTVEEKNEIDSLDRQAELIFLTYLKEAGYNISAERKKFSGRLLFPSTIQEKNDDQELEYWVLKK